MIRGWGFTYFNETSPPNSAPIFPESFVATRQHKPSITNFYRSISINFEPWLNNNGTPSLPIAPTSHQNSASIFTLNGRMWVTDGERAHQQKDISYSGEGQQVSILAAGIYGDIKMHALFLECKSTALIRDVFITSISCSPIICCHCIFVSRTRPTRCISSPLLFALM